MKDVTARLLLEKDFKKKPTRPKAKRLGAQHVCSVQ